MFGGRRRNRSNYGFGRIDTEVLEATPEHLRIEIDQIFKDFLTNSESNEYIFPSNLNNLQRKYIHEKAKAMNIISKSYGNAPHRKLHIKKKPKSPFCQSFGITPCNQSLQILAEFMHMGEPIHVPIRPQPPKPLNDIIYGKLTDMPAVNVKPPNPPEAILQFKENLPVTAMREEIMEKINNNQVLVLSSETGSGKTTQIPQFLLEDMHEKGLPCKIICTQPRRISTVSVASRVAEERGECLGESVGYHIRLEQNYGSKTGLIYCTNGVLLRSLMGSSRILSNVTHIIVDEVHERDRLSDFLLICIKQNLSKHPNLKVILMSATVNVDKFRNYFNADVLTLPGRQFPIQEFFLDDILVNLNYMSRAMADLKARGGVEVNTPISSICEYQNLSMDRELELYARCNGLYMEPSSQIRMYILSENAAVDYQHSQTGITSLMMAAAFGDENLLAELIQLGANVNIQCRNGKTAVDYALENGQETAYRILTYYKHSQEPPHVNASKELLSLYDKTTVDDEIDYDLIVALLQSIHNSNQEGAILIFLPGYDDIMMCNDRIQECGLSKSSFRTFFLHGSMNIRDQHDVFKHLPGNQRKIILSTNIAETSITIDDVVFVIDCGRAKEKSYDSYNKLSSLQTQWISQACVKQRAGRAGRTGPGVCFHIFSHQRYTNMDKERVPEILRVSLEELCLHTKILAPRNMDIFTFLAQAPDPPSANSVKVAIESLQALGALDEMENLTKLGEYLAQLTIEPRLGKMLIHSVIFRCMEPVLTLTACMAHKDPFQMPPQANLRSCAGERRKSLIYDVPSDHLIFLKAFIKWQDECQRGRGYDFCREYFISKSAMEAILDTRRQLLSQLRAMGLIPQVNIHEFNKLADSWPLVKAVISAGLYPNLAFPSNASTVSTRHEKKVYIPHTSVLSKAPKIATWLVFDELVKTKNNFAIKGITAISPITIALVCGNVTEPVCGSTFLVDKWLEIEGINEFILRFRMCVRHLVDKVLYNPSAPYGKFETRIVQTLHSVLMYEDQNLRLPQAAGIGVRPSFFHNIPDRRRFPSDDSQYGVRSHNHLHRRSHNHGLMNQEGFERNFQSACTLYDYSQASNFGEKLIEERFPDIQDDVIYVLIKPKQVKSVNIAFSKHTWVFSPQTEKKIMHYSSREKEVRLIFTVLGSSIFQGIAKFVSFNKMVGKPTATLDWLYKFDLPYNKTRHLRNPYNKDRSIYDGCDGQLIEKSVGEELVRVYDEFIQQQQQMSQE